MHMVQDSVRAAGSWPPISPLSLTLSKPPGFTGLGLLFSKAPSNSEILCHFTRTPGYQ